MDKRKTKRELCVNRQQPMEQIPPEMRNRKVIIISARASFVRSLRQSTEHSSVVVFVLISNMQRPQRFAGRNSKFRDLVDWQNV